MNGLSPTERLSLDALALTPRDLAEADRVTLVQATMAVCTDMPLELRHGLSDYLNALLWPRAEAAEPARPFEQVA